MGWFDGVSEVNDDDDRHRRRKSSSHRKQSNSGASFFGLGGENYKNYSTSRGSFFGGRSSSYYKRSPRRGFIERAYRKLRQLLRDLIYYMKRNPMKVFMLVIMPLITGGALTGLLRQFGIRLPAGVERVFAAMGGGGHGGFGVGRGRDGEMQFERERYEGPLGKMESMVGGASGLLGVAKMFM